MATDYIRYDVLTQDALRGVVRTVLADAAAKGLPGDHHFFISFDTRADGVKISPRLHAQYPEEMTIVLQHQFWDLTVGVDHFEVGLSFNGIPERLIVPLSALKGFFDPSVQFGLQFATAGDGEGAAAGSATAPAASEPATTVSATSELLPPPANPVASHPTTAKAKETAVPDGGPDKPSGGGEVVRLDRFRKK